MSVKLKIPPELTDKGFRKRIGVTVKEAVGALGRVTAQSFVSHAQAEKNMNAFSKALRNYYSGTQNANKPPVFNSSEPRPLTFTAEDLRKVRDTIKAQYHGKPPPDFDRGECRTMSADEFKREHERKRKTDGN